MRYLLIFVITLLFSCEKVNIISVKDYNNLSFCHNEQFDSDHLSILSFNRLNNTSIHSVVSVIETTNPDIIGLQESYDIGFQIADRFNYCFYGNDDNSTAILSKYPLQGVNELYCKVFLNDSLFINFFNIHLTAQPYQPYDIRDTLITTPLQAIHQAEQTRGAEIDKLTENILSINNNMPLVVVGDFNEPSHLDWVLNTENAQLFQYINSTQFVVNWPGSIKLNNCGLIDCYRYIFPDPISKPGYTWNTVNSTNAVHDRIDFIYYKPNNTMTIDSMFVVGKSQEDDIFIEDYQSDHRAILVTFKLN